MKTLLAALFLTLSFTAFSQSSALCMNGDIILKIDKDFRGSISSVLIGKGDGTQVSFTKKLIIEKISESGRSFSIQDGKNKLQFIFADSSSDEGYQRELLIEEFFRQKFLKLRSKLKT